MLKSVNSVPTDQIAYVHIYLVICSSADVAHSIFLFAKKKTINLLNLKVTAKTTSILDMFIVILFIVCHSGETGYP